MLRMIAAAGVASSCAGRRCVRPPRRSGSNANRWSIQMLKVLLSSVRMENNTTQIESGNFKERYDELATE